MLTPRTTLILTCLYASCTPLFAGLRLHDAASQGDVKKCMQLLTSGADVNAIDNQGYTPLHYAALNGHSEACAALIHMGAIVHARNFAGWTSLHLAAAYGHSEACGALVHMGAGVNEGNFEGWTALHLAAFYGRQETCAMLIHMGADVNLKNYDGQTPLEVMNVVSNGAKANNISKNPTSESTTGWCLLLNIINLPFGLLEAFLWALPGVGWCITIIGIPFGIQCFKMAQLAIWPFGTKVVIDMEGELSFVLNVIWVFFTGFWSALGYIIEGVFFCITLIGIPWGLQKFKMAKLAWMPFGAKLV